MSTPVINRLVAVGMMGIKHYGGVRVLSVTLSGGETPDEVKCDVRFVTKHGHVEVMVTEVTCGSYERRRVF